MFEHDTRLARWFAQNGSIITSGQADAIGLGQRALLRRHEAGLLVREFQGVYRDASVPSTFDTNVRAAVWAAGPDAVVAGHSLMRLYGVRGEWRSRPEIAVIGSADHLVLPGVLVRRIDRVETGDRHRRQGLPVLAPALGLLTLGASAPPWKVETAVHDMVFQGHTALPLLLRTLKEYGAQGRDGVTSYRAAVRSLDPKGRATQTNLELTALRAIAADPSIPEPHVQVPVVDGDGRKRKLDLAWPDDGLDLEVDGDRWHLSPPDKCEMKKRDAALLAVGYETWRVDSDQVSHDLRAILARLRTFFGA
jgi:hypothetical protein